MSKAKKTVEVYQSRSKSQDWRWRLIASNGKIVAASSEGFSSKAAAKRNILNVSTSLGSAEIVVKVPKKAKATATKPAKASKPVKATKPAKVTKPRAKKADASKVTVKELAKAVKYAATKLAKVEKRTTRKFKSTADLKLRKSKSTADLKVVAA